MAEPNPNLHVETSVTHVRFVGGLLLLTAISLIYLLVSLWPSSAQMSGKAEATVVVPPIVAASAAASASVASSAVVNSQTQESKSSATPSQASKGLSLEQRLLLLVMIAGALGSFIHIATSFAEFAGRQEFEAGWIWWYLLKPFIGAALAVIFYLVLRGGLMTQGSGDGSVNIYGVVSMGGMVGMFSKQATAKLAEVFDTLFKTTPKNKSTAVQDPAPGAAVPAAAPSADASDLHDTTSGALPNPPVTEDHELPPAKGGVAVGEMAKEAAAKPEESKAGESK